MRKYIIILLTMVLSFACGDKKEFKYWERIKIAEDLTESDILSIAVDGKRILLATYGNGAILSKDRGRKWHAVENIPEVYAGYPIISCALHDNYIFLGLSGGGILYSKDKGKSWANFSDSIFSACFLYPTKIIIKKNRTFIATTDGLIILQKKPDKIKSIEDDGAAVIDNRSGLQTSYLYDLAAGGKSILLGTLGSMQVSNDDAKGWRSVSPGSTDNIGSQSAYRVLAVEAKGKRWYAGTSNGLFISDDKGESWSDISRGLPSLYIRDLFVDDSGDLWVATAKGAAFTKNYGKSYKTFGKTSGFYSDNINCLAPGPDGKALTGTPFGIYKTVDQIPFMKGYPKPYQDYAITEAAAHQWLSRPLRAEDNNYIDQTRLYGTSISNKGCYFVRSQRAEILAVSDGTIVYISKRDGHLVLRCRNRWDGYYVYAHYFNLDEFNCYIGQKVSRKDVLGRLENKRTGNPYLYFEVSLSVADDSDIPATPYNPELWFRPLPGCGTISGQLIDPEGDFMSGIRINGAEKLSPTETPYSYSLSYRPGMNSDPDYRENFVIGDVPAGDYVLWARLDGKTDAIKVRVVADKITRVTIASGGRVDLDSNLGKLPE